MSYCPQCTRPIPYTSTLFTGTRNRPIWCQNCRVGLERQTSWATWVWFCVVVAVNLVGWIWGVWAATLPLILLDFYVDSVTLTLAPIRLDQT